jgi:hypothetical protein
LLRQDVYRAFTLAPPHKYDYSPSQDLFTSDPDLADKVPGPTITPEMLITERHEFAKAQNKDVSQRLQNALAAPKPLAEFTRILHEERLLSRWRRHHLATVNARLVAWANDHGLAVLPQWLRKAESTMRSTRRVLDLVIANMNDDELGKLLIPLHAVEAALKRLSSADPRG